MECKHCKKLFHHCTSCDPDTASNNGYCSSVCWRSSDQYKNHIAKAKKFFASLTREQLDFWENGCYDESNFFSEYCQLAKDRRKELDDYILDTRNVR
jgi:hypothetical protein